MADNDEPQLDDTVEPLAEELTSLKPDELEELVAALLSAETSVDVDALRLPRDPAADLLLEDGGRKEVFIVKTRLPPFPQLRQSVELANAMHHPQRVVVATPEEVSDTTRRRLSMTVGNYVDTWDQPVLLDLLAKHPDVRDRFFVPPAGAPATPLQRFVLWLAERDERATRQLPAWLRLALLCAVIGLLVFLPIRVTHHEAIWLGNATLVVVLLALASTAVSWKDIGDRVAAASRPLSFDANLTGIGMQLTLRFERVHVPPARMVALVVSLLVLRGLRWVGVTLTGIGFFAGWTAAYLVVWGIDSTSCPAAAPANCHAGFAGIGTDPSIGDFAYLATNVAFFSPPQDLQVVSRATHALQSVEMLMAAALLATFAAQLGVIGRRRQTQVDAEA